MDLKKLQYHYRIELAKIPTRETRYFVINNKEMFPHPCQQTYSNTMSQIWFMLPDLNNHMCSIEGCQWSLIHWQCFPSHSQLNPDSDWLVQSAVQ